MNIKISEISNVSTCSYCKRKFPNDQIFNSSCVECLTGFPERHFSILQDLHIKNILILNLYYHHEYSMAEISEKCQINPNTVRTIIHRYKKEPKPFLSISQLKSFLINSLEYIETEILN